MKKHLYGNARLLTALSLILISVSRAAAATVPNAAGLTQAAATTVIKNAGLVLGTVSTLQGSTIIAGQVIGESPAAGKTVNAGSTVNLTLSGGAAPAAPTGKTETISKLFSVRIGTIGSTALPTGFNEAVSKVFSTRIGTIGSEFLPTGYNEAVSKIFSARIGTIGSPALPLGLNEAVSKIYSTRIGTIGSPALPPGFNEAVSKLISAGVNLPANASLKLKTSLAYASSTAGGSGTGAALAAASAALTSLDGAVFAAGETITVAADLATPIFLNGRLAGNDPGSDTDLTFVVPETATAIQVRAGATADSGAAVERKTSVLTGSVTNAAGSPASNVNVHLRHAGLKAEFYTLPFAVPPGEAPALSSLQPVAEEPVSSLNLRNPEQAFGALPIGVVSSPDFAVKLSGQFLAEKDDSYNFFTAATDGAQLTIDGTLLSNVAGARPGLETAVPVRLAKGWHDIELVVSSSSGSAELSLTYAPPGGDKQLIDPKLLRADSSVLRAVTGPDGKFKISAPAWLDQVEAVVPSPSSSGKFSAISAPAVRGLTNLGAIQLAPAQVSK